MRTWVEVKGAACGGAAGNGGFGAHGTGTGRDGDSRKVCYCEARILVEVLRFYKAL